MNRVRVAAGTGILGMAMLIAVPLIKNEEGTKLSAYQDVAGVYTICSGIAYVKPGTKYTQAQCDKLTESTVAQYMKQVASLITVKVSPEVLASHTSFAFNIGLTGYKRSSTLRYTNQGNIAAGCEAMRKWETAGGRDCNIKSNNCAGLVIRRESERVLCLSGINL